MQEFGRLFLNKNPENYHRDVEKSAFSPGSMVPGIEESPDMLLQLRMFLYRDAQYHRLGINLHDIPGMIPSPTSPSLLTLPSKLPLPVPLRFCKHGLRRQRRLELFFLPLSP